MFTVFVFLPKLVGPGLILQDRLTMCQARSLEKGARSSNTHDEVEGHPSFVDWFQPGKSLYFQL